MTESTLPAEADVVIVGAGHGGAHVATQLRTLGYGGSILLLTDERDFPYERPPLSKDYLLGKKPLERLWLKAPEYWADNDIQFASRVLVVSVDAEAKIVVTADGEAVRYGQLVWAAGGAPRRLSCQGAELRGVHVVRTRADVDTLNTELSTVQHVAVVGAGYIGLEAAAVLRQLGKEVTVIEATDRALARVSGPELGRYIQGRHEEEGVSFRLGTLVTEILGEGGQATGVRCDDDQVVKTDLVVVGIGIIPAVGPLRDAGAAGENGVHVDAQCRTSLVDVFAIGDCAAHENKFAGGEVIRLESVQNARDQGAVVAKAITGQSASYDAVPWFWSDQYDIHLQTVGLSVGYEEAILRGLPETNSFSLVYLRDGRVIALDCINAPRDYMAGRRLVASGAAVDPGVLADSGIDLKSLL